jgi:excisionase family DNA binding protein
MDDMDDWDTPNELAERLHVTRQVVTKWLRKGVIRGFRVGGHWRIGRTEVDRILREGIPPPRSGKEESNPPVS